MRISDWSSDVCSSDLKNNDGEGQAFSMELGKRWAAGSKLSITPQVQLTWSDIGFDAFTDPHGALVSNDYGKHLEGRAGISLDHRNSWQDSSGKSQIGRASCRESGCESV